MYFRFCERGMELTLINNIINMGYALHIGKIMVTFSIIYSLSFLKKMTLETHYSLMTGLNTEIT